MGFVRKWYHRLWGLLEAEFVVSLEVSVHSPTRHDPGPSLPTTPPFNIPAVNRSHGRGRQ